MTKPFGEEPFRFAYINSWETVPPKLVDKEIGLLLLQLVTLFHALGSRRIGLWIGFTFFGLVLEVIGFAAGTHYHAQFLLQVVHFLPLKELLFYPLTMYPSWLAVEKLRLRKVWECAVAMGVIQHFANLPYDSFAARPGFGWTYMDPTFGFSNFDRSAWHGGVAAIFYGWLGFGVATGAACALARNAKANTVNTIFMLEISAFVACALWSPYHWMKVLGCSTLWDVPALLADPLLLYGRCVHESAMRDDLCWGLTLAALLAAFFAALRGAGRHRRCEGGVSDWLMVIVTCLYHAGVFVAYAQFDHDPSSIVPLWALNGFAACIVHIACHAHGSRHDVEIKAKAKKDMAIAEAIREGLKGTVDGKPWSWKASKPANDEKTCVKAGEVTEPDAAEEPASIEKLGAKPGTKPVKEKKDAKAEKGKNGSKAKKND